MNKASKQSQADTQRLVREQVSIALPVTGVTILLSLIINELQPRLGWQLLFIALATTLLLF
jgi:hypothetical protein